MLQVLFCTLAILLCASTAMASVHPGWTNTLKPKGKPGLELILASGGKAYYPILLPAIPTPQEEKAAADLAFWFKEMSGAEFAAVREGPEHRSSGPEISIGYTEIFKRAKLPEARVHLGDEGYAICQVGPRLYLWGGRRRGPLYAVYALLEEDLGCRWYSYDYTVIPRVADLRLRPVSRHSVPLLELRDPFYYPAFDEDWSLHNRTNAVNAKLPLEWGSHASYPMLGRHVFLAHTFHDLVPKEKYWDTNPEYYEELKGKRQPTQLCLTNLDVLRIAIEKVREQIIANPGVRYVSVSQDDGWPLCECSKCGAISNAEGSKSGALLQFVNKVAEALEKDHPTVTISTLAYLDTLMPPKTIRPRRNVVIVLCTDSHAWLYPFLFAWETDRFRRALAAWHAIGARIYVWDYTVNFSHYLIPMPNMPVVTPNMRFYIKYSVKGIMLEGASHTLGSENAALRTWVWSKQMWDPSRDTRALIRDFIYGYYGSAAQPLYEYNLMLWRLWEQNHLRRHTPKTPMSDNPIMVQEVGGIRYRPDIPLFSRDFMDRSSALFEEAERLAAVDPALLQRVKLAKLPILYLKLSRALGFIDDKFYPGSLPSTGKAEYPVDQFRSMIEEVEEIRCYGSRIGAFSGRMDPSTMISKWQEILRLHGAKDREAAQQGREESK